MSFIVERIAESYVILELCLEYKKIGVYVCVCLEGVAELYCQFL